MLFPMSGVYWQRGKKGGETRASAGDRERGRASQVDADQKRGGRVRTFRRGRGGKEQTWGQGKIWWGSIESGHRSSTGTNNTGMT